MNKESQAWADEHAGELISGLDDTTRDEVRDILSSGFRDGLTPDEIADNIKSAYAFSDDRADLIAVTEAQIANGQGNVEGLKQAKSAGLGVLKEWVCDPDPCDDCQENEDAGAIEVDEDFPSGDSAEPAHPNCFLSHTLVSARGVTNHFKRYFRGEIIILSIAGNNDISVTPNHPILTENGWIASGKLKLGDKVAKFVNSEFAVPVKPQNNYIETRIDEIANSLLMTSGVANTSMPTSAIDFHGDGMVNGKVDVINSASSLALDGSILFKDFIDDAFTKRHFWREFLYSFCPQFKFFNRHFSSSGGVISCFSAITSLLRSCFGRASDTCFTSAYKRITRFNKSLANISTGATDNAAYLFRSLAGHIQFVEIIDIRKGDFSGHVYNLSTANHWYIAENIIVHNCQCYVQGVVDDEQSGSGDEAE